MQEILVALFAGGIGVLFCFYGYKAMRILFPLWGLIAGYWFGASMINLITGDGFFGTALSIATGIVFALIFAVLAYLFYAVSVVLFMGLIGYWLGAGLLITIGVRPGIVTFLVGLAVGVVLVMASLSANVPKYLLLLITSFTGAALLVTGVLVLGNVVNIPELKNGAIEVVTNQTWIWQLLWVGLGAAGLLTQAVNSENEEIAWIREWETQ